MSIAGESRSMGGCIALVLLLGLVLAPSAKAQGPTTVEIGKVRLAAPVEGRGALLVPVRYPIQLVGKRVELRVSIGRRGAVRTWTVRERANGGALRIPETRRGFVFVHQIDLSRRLTARLRQRHAVDVNASEALDDNRDGHADLDSSDRERQLIPRGYARRLCADVPRLRGKPAVLVAVKLPACGSKVRWRITQQPEQGRARIRGGRLIYRSAQRFRGTAGIELSARTRGASGSARTAAQTVPVQIEIASGKGPKVRALGDSVTAGFGYYDDGSEMSFTSLFSCKPGKTTYDDACSSNSTNRSNEDPTVVYAPDYGLANNVSWAAQWANEHGVTNYANFAVSGSEPSDWIAGGQLYDTTKRIEAEEPDYILMTMGANPLLSEMLFGIDKMGCAIWAEVFGRYRECIEEAFAAVGLRANLKRLYDELAEHTGATIYLMQYPLSVPASALAYSATQIAMMVQLLNEEIASVAAEVSTTRLRVIAPPHFNVGIDVSPVYPSAYSCSSLGFQVDGRSVQSEPSQDELLVDHPLSFCSGPAEGPPWVIGGDTGIHPSAAGYAQMAAQIPAPG
ncbi:MAG: SGNH/GDSL hydrolase family protein [Solirubrobacterales bacterium]